MVEIEYKPIKKIIIHEMNKHKSEDMIERAALDVASGRGMPLSWANKILFASASMEQIDVVVKDQLNGIYHWANVNFALYEEFKPEVKSKKNITIQIVDVSDNKILNKVTKWLYKQANP